MTPVCLIPKEETIGAAYKGFNDTLASWGSNRIMNQQCGQTWLETFSKINSMYNSGKPLPYLQLVTWNDYEEATEIESGIDNCLTVSASAAANSLQWSVNGQREHGGPLHGIHQQRWRESDAADGYCHAESTR